MFVQEMQHFKILPNTTIMNSCKNDFQLNNVKNYHRDFVNLLIQLFMITYCYIYDNLYSKNYPVKN